LQTSPNGYLTLPDGPHQDRRVDPRNWKGTERLLDLEELDDKTLELLRTDYEKLARKAKSRTRTPLRAQEVPIKPPGSNKSRA
jgi:hypothetical protein